MNTKILESIGLTRNQSEVYLSLLKLSSATAQQIINESGMHRSRVYDSLDKLQEQGLVSFVVKNFKKYFQAAPPSKLYSFLDEKRQALKKVISELEGLEGMKREEINACVYKGKEGLKTIHTEMLKLNRGEKICVLGAKALIYSELEYYIPHFERDRVKRGIKWKLLWDTENAKEKANGLKLMEGKVLPKGFESKGVVNIFGNKVAIVLWEEKYPSGFMISNKDISDSFRKWFDLIWKTAKK
ncbi:MAG: helix-turn-helix domain-containing protein [Candidatus Nanoarchaeia archaeon]|nr:helix-turn-helix domain-containing protein [Candidatus Nanoarchaeia archaeon]MDD5741531.1 helix-turn-helix domain-containing protein [Candidatus Nanoarchaeia archaeon]